MIENPESLKTIIEDLVNKHQAKLAREILDYYYTRCETLADYDVLGYLCLKNSYAELSVKAAEDAYALTTNSLEMYAARTNLYKAYNAANMPEKALFYTGLNLKITPEDFDTQVFHAANLKLNGQRGRGEKLIQQAIDKGITDKQKRDIRSTHSHKFLRKGDTGYGIDLFLGVKKDKATTFHLMGMERWNGKPKKGKKLYIYEGGGIGDTFINVRFMEHVKDLGMEPVLYSNLGRESVMDVLYRNGFNVQTHGYGIDNSCPHTELMVLPCDMRLKEKDLWRGPYITPLKQEHTDLGPKKKFRIGIKCNGNPYFAQDMYRSIPFEKMMGAMPDDVEVYYIDTEQEFPGVINLKDRINNWEDTLDYVSQMDIVVSSCTSLPHIAGAMGIPTAVMVPIAEYYIWSSSRQNDTSPWYSDNFRVFKQKKVRNWDEPLEKANKYILKIMKENGYAD